MEIKIISNLAKTCLNNNDYEKFMSKINNQGLNSARLFIEDKIDNLMFSSKIESISHKKQYYNNLKKLDDIVTNTYINKLDVNEPKRISK